MFIKLQLEYLESNLYDIRPKNNQSSEKCASATHLKLHSIRDGGMGDLHSEEVSKAHTHSL